MARREDKQYLVLDIETGGVHAKSTILTFSAILVDYQLNTIDTLNFELIPDDGLYIVEPGGMLVNKVDLPTLAHKAEKYSQVSKKILAFLRQHSNEGKNKIIPVGYGVYFDLTHIWNHLIPRNKWEAYCSYQVLDIRSAIQFFNFLEIFNIYGGLADTTKALGVVHDGVHTALGDCEATIAVMKKLKEELTK